MTFLFSGRKTSPVLFIFFFSLPRGRINAFAASAPPKFIYISGMPLKGGGCHEEDGWAHFGSQGANVWKKAGAGDSAQSSQECRGSRNIRSLKCFLKHFLKRHGDQLLSPRLYLPLSHPPSLKNYPPLLLQPPKNPAPHYANYTSVTGLLRRFSFLSWAFFLLFYVTHALILLLTILFCQILIYVEIFYLKGKMHVCVKSM